MISLTMFSSTTNYKGEMGSRRERERGKEGEHKRGSTEAPPQSLCAGSCVFSACSFTLTLVRQRLRGGEQRFSLTERGRGGRNSLPLSPKKGRQHRKQTEREGRKCYLLWGSGICLHKPALCTCSAPHHCVSRWRGCRAKESWTTWSGRAIWLTEREWWSRTPGPRSMKTAMMLGWPYSSGNFF